MKSDKKVKITVNHNLEEGVMKKISVDADIAGRNEMGKIDFAALRAGGLIKQRQKDKFTVRLNCPGGRMSVEKLKAVAEAADEFGGDFVHFSTRQSLEITSVDYHNFKPLIEQLKEKGQEVASCGPRVRVPTACGGCEYNPNGITDTQAMADEVTKLFFGERTSHKFKTAFSACPHDCIRSVSSDLGFQGGIFPKWEEELCTGCTICSSACTEGAIVSDAITGKPIFDASQCVYCDDCVRACPTYSWKQEKEGHIVRVGGHGGRHPIIGTIVAMFLTDAEALDLIDATIKWYVKAAEGKGKIRIGNLLQDRDLLNDYMLALEQVLGKEKLVENPEPPLKIITNPKGVTV